MTMCALQIFFFLLLLLLIIINHVNVHCGDVCGDVILMPQFLEVVRQHILRVVDNFIHFSVANLTVKEF